MTPQQQLELILADRAAADPSAGPASPPSGWTPFFIPAPRACRVPAPGIAWWRELDLLRPTFEVGTARH
ncbi:hypothetical protein FDO65_06195 [Nakamurella flava]|uniref:Uncharacterized protein n=1 Tax=Nakamurella flava TaxID=2576308 RepID=A0A4U6QLP7_9ACTN|nr:hypothetical protein [Nakamurella flava]TKV61209.1 hypothetical protein FDO65_06195 [Nakamurella flava]